MPMANRSRLVRERSLSVWKCPAGVPDESVIGSTTVRRCIPNAPERVGSAHVPTDLVHQAASFIPSSTPQIPSRCQACERAYMVETSEVVARIPILANTCGATVHGWAAVRKTSRSNSNFSVRRQIDRRNWLLSPRPGEIRRDGNARIIVWNFNPKAICQPTYATPNLELSPPGSAPLGASLCQNCTVVRDALPPLSAPPVLAPR